MFLYIVPIFCCFSTVPCILPGSPFLPFITDNTFVVTNSPVDIFINSLVSISVIPCPNAIKALFLGSYNVIVPIPAALSLTHNPNLYPSFDSTGVILHSLLSPFLLYVTCTEFPFDSFTFFTSSVVLFILFEFIAVINIWFIFIIVFSFYF